MVLHLPFASEKMKGMRGKVTDPRLCTRRGFFRGELGERDKKGEREEEGGRGERERVSQGCGK